MRCQATTGSSRTFYPCPGPHALAPYGAVTEVVICGDNLGSVHPYHLTRRSVLKHRALYGRLGMCTSTCPEMAIGIRV
eukprot:2916279-Rhodomonas_salina.1